MQDKWACCVRREATVANAVTFASHWCASTDRQADRPLGLFMRCGSVFFPMGSACQGQQWGDYETIKGALGCFLQPRGPLCKRCFNISLGFPLMKIEDTRNSKTKSTRPPFHFLTFVFCASVFMNPSRPLVRVGHRRGSQTYHDTLIPRSPHLADVEGIVMTATKTAHD